MLRRPQRIGFFTSAMAFVTLMSRGQTRGQLWMVRQRQTPSRSSIAWRCRLPVDVPFDVIQQVEDAAGGIRLEVEVLTVGLVSNLGLVAADREGDVHGNLLLSGAAFRLSSRLSQFLLQVVYGLGPGAGGVQPLQSAARLLELPQQLEPGVPYRAVRSSTECPDPQPDHDGALLGDEEVDLVLDAGCARIRAAHGNLPVAERQLSTTVRCQPMELRRSHGGAELIGLGVDRCHWLFLASVIRRETAHRDDRVRAVETASRPSSAPVLNERTGHLSMFSAYYP